MFGLIVICNWLTLPVAFWRIIIGPVEASKIYWTWCFIINFYTYALFLPGGEHAAIKFVSVVILKRMLPLQDDFFSTFLLLFNMVISVVFSCVNCYTIGPQKARRRYQGLPMDLAEHTPMQFK